MTTATQSVLLKAQLRNNPAMAMKDDKTRHDRDDRSNWMLSRHGPQSVYLLAPVCKSLKKCIQADEAWSFRISSIITQYTVGVK